MATITPKKLVHWALNASLSDLGSPFSDAGSSESCSSTSSLQYINSQLIAHGFVHDSGLSLDGLAKADADRVVKCMLGMLSQRIDDMSRTEDLTTKLRTLSYDHERLTSMFKSEADKAANAEREMNLHKTRMTAATKSLQSCENAHKHTTSELQRTRSTLHALRATHQTEIKKVEKEKERMVERWSKLSDAQLKAGSLRAGLTCANLDVVEASDVQLRGKGQGFLDVALEQAESARLELYEQNRKLRGSLLSAANQLQSVLHAARTAGDPEYREERPLLSASTLFSSSPAEAADETLNSLFTSLRETISQKANSSTTSLCSCSRNVSSSTSASAQPSKAHDYAEIDRLQAVIDKLRAELDQSQKQAATSAAQTQELFDRFAEEQRLSSTGPAEMSVELLTVPARDEEQRRLDERFKELEDERRKFTEAAVRLGREKAALEAERLKFLEEKRSWEVEMMLAELPPTPAPAGAASSPKPSSVPAAMLPPASPRRSPRKRKSVVASARKTRVSRRSSGLGVALSPRAKQKVQPAYETEVIPPTIPAIPPSPSRQMPEFKTSMAAPPPPSPSFLTNAFVLPPPSPAASLPSRDALPPIPPLPKLEIPPSSEDTSDDNIMDTTPQSLPSSSSTNSLPSSASSSSSTSEPPLSGPGVPVPSTPVVRPFPMAKPFAQRMIHAYSPVKPSPLSRILMMADSPESPESPGARLDALAEVDENAMDMDTSHIPVHTKEPVRTLSLAEELGISEEDDSPFREAQAPPPLAPAQGHPSKRRAESTRGGASAAEKGKSKDTGKGKDKAAPAAHAASRARAGAPLEKENVKRAKLSPPESAPPQAHSRGARGAGRSSGGSSSSSSSSGSRDGKKPVGIGARARAQAQSGGGANAKAQTQVSKPRPALKGGPRRVPMGSAEAASVPTWRG
ncbi:Afadin and alpha-actinin-binding-domain-containing protein [Earliella scabrosa]|nr:Afadin and alpha-actinin-binding-domain-containing protein [Earliella scabrosa]